MTSNNMRRFVLLSLFVLFGASTFGQTIDKKATRGVNGKIAMKHAKGTFEVKVTPLKGGEDADVPSIGRLSLEKVFEGDISAKSKGQMLGNQSKDPGTGGYVAMESIDGSLNGRQGGFLLQHYGTMIGGEFDLLISIVPGSGSGELAGISGKMSIKIEKGKHFYDLEYSLPSRK